MIKACDKFMFNFSSSNILSLFLSNRLHHDYTKIFFHTLNKTKKGWDRLALELASFVKHAISSCNIHSIGYGSTSN